MKKLRIALIVLLAAMMSLFLFACNNGSEKDPVGGEEGSMQLEVINVTGSITIVDTLDAEAGKTAVLEQLHALTLKGIYTNDKSGKSETKEIPSSDYDDPSSEMLAKIEFGTVGTYSVAVQPKTNNDYNVAVQIPVNIEHDFQPVADKDGVYSCAHDGATQILKDLEDSLRFEGWCAAGTPKLGEKNTGAVAFGNSAEGLVPTATVGRIDKGMSISITGKAKTINGDNGGNNNVWNFPILGIANRETAGGFVLRNDYWGIWDVVNLPTWTKEFGKGNDGAAAGEATVDSEEMVPYYYGNSSFSEDYAEWVDVQFTWSYSMDGIMKITWLHTQTGKEFGFTMKMADRQYYETILHGEFVDMEFTKLSVTQNLKLEKITGIEVDEASFLENTYLDYSIFKVGVEYAGNFTATADPAILRVFANEADFADADEATALAAEGWVELDVNKMSPKFKSYKLIATIGSDSIERLVPATEAAKITVIPNAVNSVVANDITANGVKFIALNTTDNANLDGLTFAQKDNKVNIVLSGVASTLTDAQKAVLNGETTAKHYVAFTVYANAAGFTKFNTENVTVDGTAYFVNATEMKLEVILAVDAGILASGVTLHAQETDILVTFADGFRGVNATSNYDSTKTALKLDESKAITIVYDLNDAAATDAKAVAGKYAVTINGTQKSFRVEGDGSLNVAVPTVSGINGFTMGAISFENGKLSVTYNVPAFNPASPVNYNVKLIDKNAGITLVSDTIYYELAFATEQNLAGNYYTIVNGTTMYLVKAFNETNLTTSNLSGEAHLTVNQGAATPEKFKTATYIANHDLSYRVTADGKVFFTSSTLLPNLVNASLAAFGTIGNSEDTDRGALLIFTVDLTKVGIAADTAFAYAVDATVAEGGFYKTVSATGEIGASVAFTTPAARISLADGNCLNSSDMAFEIGGTGDAAMLYAFPVISYAEHVWKEIKLQKIVDDATEEVTAYKCDNCGSIRNYEEENKDVAAEKILTGALGDLSDGLTLALEARNMTGDWDSHLATTAEGNVIITNPNLDPWNNTVASVADATARQKELGAKLASTNLFPTSNGTSYLQNGGAFNTALNNVCYLTVTISTEYGIQYYRNGVLFVSYPANAEMGGSNAGEYAELFLSLAGQFGLVLNDNSNAPMANFTILKKAMLAGQVRDLYAAYSGEAVEPGHNYVNGVCTDCGRVQAEDLEAAGFTADGWSQENVTGANFNLHEITKLEKGHKLVVIGQQKSAVGENWHALLWEISEGWTGRMDNFGWNYSDNFAAWGTTSVSTKLQVTNADGEVDGGDIWANYKKIAADCTWRVELDWTGDDIIATVSATANGDDLAGYTFTYVATLDVLTSITEINLHVGAEEVTLLSVLGYKVI